MTSSYWERRLALERLPPEPPRIPRRYMDANLNFKFAGDVDESVLDDPPDPPAVKRPGRTNPMNDLTYAEIAMDFLHHADPPLTGKELFVWASHVAKVPLRRIASQLGVSHVTVINRYLDPLRKRAGLG